MAEGLDLKHTSSDMWATVEVRSVYPEPWETSAFSSEDEWMAECPHRTLYQGQHSVYGLEYFFVSESGLSCHDMLLQLLALSPKGKQL